MSVRRSAAILAVGLLALFSARAWAHEEKDPVCGMMVEIEKAAGTAVYAGQTYYFCSQGCLDAFRTEPERYVSALRLFELRQGMAVAFTARPRVPKPGDLVRLYLQVGPPQAGGMIPDSGALLKLRDPVAHVFLVDRSAPPQGDVRHLHETEEAGTYGLSKQIESEGLYRIYFEADLPDGRPLRVGFEFTTLGALPKDDHAPAAAPVAPVAPVEPSPSWADPLPMAEQHETMKRIGALWRRLEDELADVETPEARMRAQETMDRILAWSRNLGGFQLHKFPEQKAELLALNGEMQTMLGGLRELARGGRRDDAVRRHREIDAISCTKCHLKFRWGAIPDLSRFPALEGQRP